MAVTVNVNELGDGGGDYKKETEIIPAGFQICRLVSYIEMGHHHSMFKGKTQTYESGKRQGEIKDPEMMIHLIFEFTNAKYTGDFPLTIKTSVPFGKNGDLLNKLSIGKGLEEGWLSRANALKSNFVKTLMAMQDATGSDSGTLSDYVGKVFGCTVVHNLGKKADDNGDIPRFANMKCTSLVAPEFTNPMDGVVTDMGAIFPEQIGEYCPVFDWAEPTIAAWTEVPKYIKKFTQTALDYSGSELEIILAGYEEEKPADEPQGTTDAGAPATTGGASSTGGAYTLNPENDTPKMQDDAGINNGGGIGGIEADDDIPF